MLIKTLGIWGTYKTEKDLASEYMTNRLLDEDLNLAIDKALEERYSAWDYLEAMTGTKEKQDKFLAKVHKFLEEEIAYQLLWGENDKYYKVVDA